MKLNFISVLGYNVFSDELSKIDLRNKFSFIINTINPHSYIVAKKDLFFQQALKQSDVLLADGIGIVWAIKFLNRKKTKRITGPAVFLHLMKELNLNCASCFFLGASQITLDKIKKRAKSDYPNVKLGTYSPPFKNEFSKEDSAKMVSEIKKFQPEVLFVGMTAPKQEKWVMLHKKQLNINIIVSIGAAFDFYAGTTKRSGKFWQKTGLEWFSRLLREPTRLWKRNFISGPYFVWNVLIEKFNFLK